MTRASAPAKRRTTTSGASSARGRDARPGSSAQRVTCAAHCLDEPPSTTRLQLVAQVFDAHVDQVRVAHKVKPPDLLEDLLAREHLARMPQEQFQQLVLAGGEVQRFTVATGFPFGRHDLHILEAED